MAENHPPHSAAAPRRRRKTRWTVRLGDALSRRIITIGGAGTILAVLLVCFFLLGQVIPLFLPGQTQTQAGQSSWVAPHAPEKIDIDEYRQLAWACFPDGRLSVTRIATGEVLESRALFPDAVPSAFSFGLPGDDSAFGFPDGRIQILRLSFATSFLDDATLPDSIRALQPGQSAIHQAGLVTRTSEGQFRATRLALIPGLSAAVSDAPLRLVAFTPQGDTPTLAALDAQNRLALISLHQKKNVLTGKVRVTPERFDIPFTLPAGRGQPIRLLLSARADNLYVLWPDGFIQRYDTRDPAQARLAEERNLLEDPAARVTAVSWIAGKNTFVLGDSRGRVQAWFSTRLPQAGTPDGRMLVRPMSLRLTSSAITSLASSPRSRVIAAGTADGRLELVHVTSHKRVADVALSHHDQPIAQPITLLAIAPKEDGLVAAGDSFLQHLSLDPGFPEAAPTSVFLPVWYEGYAKPEFIWQTSASSDDVEPKFSLIPLIFGTFKATVYSMLIALPLALLAAIYTSEFLHPRWKARIKPTVEIMASLPSVVLGFLAGLVFAPFVEPRLGYILAAVLAVPFTLLLTAHLWQLLPQRWTLRYQSWRLLLIVLALPAGLALGWLLGPALEHWLFAGDIHTWLHWTPGAKPSAGDSPYRNPAGGLMFFTLPVTGLLILTTLARWINPRLRRVGQNWTRFQFALMQLAKFVLACAAALGVAYLLGMLLGLLGFDPRGTPGGSFLPTDFLGTFVQRNALIVGFAMGFAVIPIIYTIAEDALSSVPEHLRSASLGAGATPWQTATRIIIPTAASGLFSATMIGLGRAVGETMIVLMAAGNTPIMDWNIFNGFQTLAAAIATEMPEAPRGSTHYRMLFLAALCLFVLTFLLNTLAEIVRQRFRKRAFQL